MMHTSKHCKESKRTSNQAMYESSNQSWRRNVQGWRKPKQLNLPRQQQLQGCDSKSPRSWLLRGHRSRLSSQKSRLFNRNPHSPHQFSNNQNTLHHKNKNPLRTAYSQEDERQSKRLHHKAKMTDCPSPKELHAEKEKELSNQYQKYMLS